jgi:Spy/CpxP family protein refolding chaperone
MKTINDPSTNDTTAAASRTRRRRLVAAALVVALGTAGAGFAYGSQGLPFHHGHAGQQAMSPAAMETHIDRLLDQCGADVSADQKARVAAIARAAMTDFSSSQEPFAQVHARAHDLLMAPVIDRVALEQLRAAHIQRMDEISRRFVAGMEDAADILTPAQRAQCAAHMRAHNR